MGKNKIIFVLWFFLIAPAVGAQDSYGKNRHILEMDRWAEELVVSGNLARSDKKNLLSKIQKWSPNQWQKFKKNKAQLFFHRPLTYSVSSLGANGSSKSRMRGPASVEQKVDFNHQRLQDFSDLKKKVRTILIPTE